MRVNQRETLPNARRTEAISFEYSGMPFVAHVGRYDDGRFAELFISAAKTGTGIDTVAREVGTLLSIALQYGAEFEVIRRALPRDPRSQAMGLLGTIMDLLSETTAT